MNRDGDMMVEGYISILNENQGVLTALLFFITVLFGWLSGILSALRRKPKLKIHIIPGPTFCCTYRVGKMHGEYGVHRTGIALYLEISNVGYASTSIVEINVGYHWNILPFSKLWLKYRIGWFWLNQQSVILADFQNNIGGSVKFFPFLFQKSYISGERAETYLEIGRRTNGVVYFEQNDSFGGGFPKVTKLGLVKVKMRIRDAFHFFCSENKIRRFLRSRRQRAIV